MAIRRWLVCAALAARATLAADGDVDPAFGDRGQVMILRPPDSPTISAPTGDIVAVADGGYAWTMANADGSVSVGRASRDGAPDASFGAGGSGDVTLDECTSYAAARIVADGDGFVVWTGACLVRLDANGDVDNAFGAGHVAAADFFATSLARDDAGRFVVAGLANREWTVYRFAIDGSLDASFGDGGAATIAVPAMSDTRTLDAIAVRGDGRVLAAGSRFAPDFSTHLVVAALTADGVADPDWNDGAIVDIAPPSKVSGIAATAATLDRDGSLVVGGLAYGATLDCCLVLARFDAGGALGEGFGVRLWPVESIALGFFERRESMVVQADHRILLGTTTFPSGGAAENRRTQFTLIRANADGTLDASFGGAGWRSYTFDDPDGGLQSGDYDQLHALAFGGESAILVGRTFFEDDSNGRDYVSFVRVLFDRVFAGDFE
jgi:uncharacterized delta-60 repeat protein